MKEISKRLLILCEDKKSSLVYLKSFQKDEQLKRSLSSVKIEIYQPSDHSPLGLVKEAKNKKQKARRERNPYDETWIVTDRDGHANMDQAMNMAKDNNINVALSVVCFEFWLLLHFERTTKPFYKCCDTISYFKNNHFQDYEKCSNCYDQVKSKIPTAIQNGEWLEKRVQIDIDNGTQLWELASYTNMHVLVKKLFYPKEYLFVK